MSIDGRFLSAGSDQLHQDLDGHGPNLWQEVGGLDVRKLVNLIQQCKWNKFNRRKVETIKWWKYDENFIHFGSGLAFKYLAKTLKSIYQAPVRLIGKRGLICDHSQLFVYFWENICC